MDIIIKSFNRPYLLDRCLTSIYKFLKGFEGTIYIVDDGTPKCYLQKIQEKFPEVVINKTEFYTKKEAFVTARAACFFEKIPIIDWIKAAQNASEYFLLLEDDIWFTQEIAIDEILHYLHTERPLMIKLSWLGNKKLIQSDGDKKINSFTQYQPKLWFKTPFLLKIFFFNRYKVRKILSFFRIYTLDHKLSFYTIYAVAGAIFDKNYFLNLWHNHNSTVNETLQLQNALNYCYKHNNYAFARTNTAVVKTSFISSATNAHKNELVGLDMFTFNTLINQLWYDQVLGFNKDFDSDLPIDIIEKALIKNGCTTDFILKWKLWMESFKQQYRAIGCEIE